MSTTYTLKDQPTFDAWQYEPLINLRGGRGKNHIVKGLLNFLDEVGTNIISIKFESGNILLETDLCDEFTIEPEGWLVHSRYDDLSSYTDKEFQNKFTPMLISPTVAIKIEDRA